MSVTEVAEVPDSVTSAAAIVADPRATQAAGPKDSHTGRRWSSPTAKI